MSIRILGTIAIDVSEIQMCVCENIYGYYVNNEHHTEYDITYLIYIYIYYNYISYTNVYNTDTINHIFRFPHQWLFNGQLCQNM